MMYHDMAKQEVIICNLNGGTPYSLIFNLHYYFDFHQNVALDVMMYHDVAKQEVVICRLDLMHLQLEILFSLMTYRRTGVQAGLLEFTDPEVSFVRFFSLSFGWPGCNFVMMPRPSLLI